MLAPRTGKAGDWMQHTTPFIVSITGAAGKEYKSNARGNRKPRGTATPGCPVERSSTRFTSVEGSGAPPDSRGRLAPLDRFVEDLQLFGDDENGFFLGQLKFLEFLLGHLDLDRRSPLAECLNFYQRAS